MEDSLLKFLVFTGIAMFALIVVGVFLVVVRVSLHFFPEITLMGVAMSGL